jgi:heme exporter protein CcmD
MANFFAMGGYAVYVWPAYGATALVLIVAAVLTLQAHRRAKNAARRLEDETGGGDGGET